MEYYEYADDLIARKIPNSSGGQFEVWNPKAAKWEKSADYARFSFTANRIPDVKRYVAQNPTSAPAFSAV